MKKRFLAFMILLMLCTPPCASAWNGPEYHYYGNREEPRVCITIDDWYEPALLTDFMAIAEEYGVKLTLYPCGMNLNEADRALWQAALDAGHEIGSHGYRHIGYTQLNNRQIKREYERFQEALDQTLGYAYEFLTVRLPYGDGMKLGPRSQLALAIHDAGFDHVVFWDWDNTKDLKSALKKIQNGSIVLMHANRSDLKFFQALMEGLRDRSYEYVTVTELLGITTRLIPREEGAQYE